MVREPERFLPLGRWFPFFVENFISEVSCCKQAISLMYVGEGRVQAGKLDAT
jgi:hypothetical protein